MPTIQATALLRLAECNGSYKDEPVIVNSRGTEFYLQQAWVDAETGETVWKNVPTVWIDDPTWSAGDS